ncbi:DUF2971 domain-containing protein [Candidatus Woesearchaeota archaeon]|nr:DUF2971 domain-containing protein [Candidatus Woesearchaeota archaeon]
MEFFIPTIPKDKTEDFFKNTIIQFIEEQGYKIKSDNRVYSITFNKNGQKTTEKVGQLSLHNNEPIFAILETSNYFLTCTTNCGIVKGEPLIIEKHNIETVEYFIKENFYNYGDWTYRLDNNNHHVDHPLPEPESVFKYYANNKFSKDAITNNYLFCSHPYHLNDSMDSSNLLWDFKNITPKAFEKFFETYRGNPILKEYPSYEEDRNNNFEIIKTSFWNIITNNLGIISLTEKPLHTLMWSHYATEKGFMIEFDKKKLISGFRKKNPSMANYVFMPIQYVKKLEKIDFFKEGFKTPDIPFLYSINIKRDDWYYEKEWRLVCYSRDYGIPYSQVLPREDYNGQVDRKFYYDADIVKSVTLGKYFFHGKNMKKFEFPNKYWLNNQNDIDLVDFIIKKYNDRLYLSDELESNNKYNRNKIKISMLKQKDDLYIMTKV